MHHSHCILRPLQLFLFGSTLLGQSISQVQASAANSGSAAHQTAQVEIDANGQVSSSSKSSSSFSPLDSQHASPGVDHSWPTHHHDSEYFPEYRKESYLNYVRGCNQQIREAVSYYNNRVNQRERFTCYKYEQDRMDMNLNQPKMMENYTHAGFAKLEIPSNVQTILKDFWQANEDWESVAKTEVWDPSNTYVNHWESPTKILDLTSGPHALSSKDKWQVVKGIQKVLEAWTKTPLVLTSLYGIRIYQEGSILAPHVDRLPLVSSAILHIASDQEEEEEEQEPWILEVIGHDGQAHNLTMQPGEMVLYESHSVIHGRPYPLKGKFYANLFVHFEPLGHTLRHVQTQADYDLDGMEEETEMTASERMAASAKAAYERAFQMEQQMHAEGESKNKKKTRRSSELPRYVDSDKENRWIQHFDYDKKPKVTPKPLRQVLVSVTPHNAAASGNLEALKTLADVDRANLFKRDQNGWRPLHEAARSGHVEVLEYLLKEGATVNERTNNGEGGTPLWWAEKKPEKNQEAIELLKKHGGLSLQPKVLDEKQKKDEQKEGKDTDIVRRQA